MDVMGIKDSSLIQYQIAEKITPAICRHFAKLTIKTIYFAQYPAFFAGTGKILGEYLFIFQKICYTESV